MGVAKETAAAAGAGRATLAGVLALAFVMNFVGRGATEAFAVFLLPVERDLGASRAEISGVYSLFMLVVGLCGPAAGWVFDRLGARAAYVGGLVVLGGSLIAAGEASRLWHIYAAVGLLAGLGMSTLGMVSANAFLSRWYGRGLGTAIGITYAAMGLGVLLFAPLAQLLVDAYGWRAAYHILGMGLLGLALAAAPLPLTRLWRGSPDWQERRRHSRLAAAEWTIPKAARTRPFWSLTFVYVFTSFAAFAVLPQSVACMVEAGIGPLAAASAFGLAGMLSLIGNATISPLVHRFGQRLMITLSYLATFLGIGCLLAATFVPSMALVYGWVVLFGVNQGTRGPIVSTAAATLFAGGGVGRIYGTISLGMGAGAALGSTVSGVLHAATGSYQAPFAAAMVAALLGMAVFWTVPDVTGRSLRA